MFKKALDDALRENARSKKEQYKDSKEQEAQQEQHIWRYRRSF